MLVAARRPFLPVVMMCVLLLAGCATSNVSLSPDEMRTIRIERVDVIYAENASISWEKVETKYIEHVNAERVKFRKLIVENEGDINAIMKTPEARQYMQAELAAELKKRLGAEILPKFQGTRRTVLEVKVHAMRIPSPMRRVVIGGSPIFSAVTVLKDSSTGQELAKLDRVAIASASPGLLGVAVDEALERPDLDERLFKNISTMYPYG